MKTVLKVSMIGIIFLLTAITPAMTLFVIIQLSPYRIPEHAINIFLDNAMEKIGIDFSAYILDYRGFCIQIVINFGLLIFGIPFYFFLKKNKIF